MPTKIDFLKAKVQAVINVLEKTSRKERENRVSVHLANEFNNILNEIGGAVQEAAPHLPKPIPCQRFDYMGFSEIAYVDLMIMSEQVLRVLSVIESHG